MADLPKRVWSGKKQVYSWKKPVWVKDWKLWVYDPNFEEVTNWQYYSPNRWGNLSSDAELQIYDDKDSLNPTDIGTFEDWLESTDQFVDWDGTVLKSWKVKDWETPVAPTDPTREHYTFTGWNPTVWPITKNTTFSAVYAIDTFTVNIWVNDPDYGDVSMSSLWSVPYGTAISASDNVLTIWETTITATAETWYQFSSWGTLPATVTENLTITASFEVAWYTVTFQISDDQYSQWWGTISEQSIIIPKQNQSGTAYPYFEQNGNSLIFKFNDWMGGIQTVATVTVTPNQWYLFYTWLNDNHISEQQPIWQNTSFTAYLTNDIATISLVSNPTWAGTFVDKDNNTITELVVPVGTTYGLGSYDPNLLELDWGWDYGSCWNTITALPESWYVFDAFSTDGGEISQDTTITASFMATS